MIKNSIKTNFEEDNKDFDKFINVNVYINGLFLINKEEERLFKIKINMNHFENNKKENCDIFKPFIEEKIKKYVVQKIKENTHNIIKLSRENQIPVKNILYSIFINNRIDNIDIIWSSSSIKEFLHVPVKHYLTYGEDTLYLKTKKFKFKKSF
jgi:hypothetical protein